MNEFKSINEYANYMQRHYNKILQIDKIIDEWILNICFRMKFSKYFNFYIFQLIHAIKINDKKFVINDIILTLIKKSKRFIYNKKKIETIKVAKNSRDININIKSNESKKNRDNNFCNDCNNSYHDKLHCFFLKIKSFNDDHVLF